MSLLNDMKSFKTSLLDIDNLESTNIGQELLKYKCSKWMENYSPYGMGFSVINDFTINTDKLYKNKYKQFKEIIENPSKYMLCSRTEYIYRDKFFVVSRTYHLRIYKEDEKIPPGFSICYKSHDGLPSYSYENIVTIDRIIKEN